MTTYPPGGADVDVDRYWSDGLAITTRPLPADTMDDIRGELAEYLGEPDSTPDFVPDLMASGFGLRYGALPQVLDAVRAVLGPDIVLWACGMFGKPAKVGKPTPWHQDGHFWPILPLATCTVWLALDRSGAHNGCLRYVAGSHRDRVLVDHRRQNGEELTLNQEVQLRPDQAAAVRYAELYPGCFSVHDVYLLHGSAANRSGARRAGITFRFMPTTSYYDRDLARRQHRELGVPDISERVLHLVSGVDRSERNDTVDSRRPALHG